MKKKEINCVLCGHKIIRDKVSQKFTCNKCGANHASDIFTSNSNKKNGFRFHYSKTKFFFSIIGALYLFYLVFRVFIY